VQRKKQYTVIYKKIITYHKLNFTSVHIKDRSYGVDKESKFRFIRTVLNMIEVVVCYF